MYMWIQHAPAHPPPPKMNSCTTLFFNKPTVDIFLLKFLAIHGGSVDAPSPVSDGLKIIINRDYITDIVTSRPDFHRDKSSLDSFTPWIELLDMPHPHLVSGEGVKNMKDVPLLVAEQLVPPSDGPLVGHLWADVEVVTSWRFICQESSVA